MSVSELELDDPDDELLLSVVAVDGLDPPVAGGPSISLGPGIACILRLLPAKQNTNSDIFKSLVLPNIKVPNCMNFQNLLKKI